MLFKWPKDGFIIIRKRLFIFFRIGDMLIDHTGLAVMRAKKITGEHHFVSFQIGEHRIRPMQERRDNKLQHTPAANVKRVAILDDDGFKTGIGNPL